MFEFKDAKSLKIPKIEIETLYDYKCPIELSINQIEQELFEDMENAIVCKISEEIGIKLDAERLIRALEFDRAQYRKGFIDGQKAAQVADKNVLDKLRAEITAIDITGQVDEHTLFIRSGEQVKRLVLEIIDKYRAEREDTNENNEKA